jgi:hypothetical protein
MMTLSKLQSIVSPLQAALVPVVLSSAGALLGILVQTRYGRITDRIRRLLGSETHSREAEKMLGMLFERARYAKWSLFGIFFGISCFLTLSLVILICPLFPLFIQIDLILTTFCLGMAAMLIGVWLEVWELLDSFKLITAEYTLYEKKFHSGSAQKMNNQSS